MPPVLVLGVMSFSAANVYAIRVCCRCSWTDYAGIKGSPGEDYTKKVCRNAPPEFYAFWGGDVGWCRDYMGVLFETIYDDPDASCRYLRSSYYY